jgi:hypothetical protein
VRLKESSLTSILLYFHKRKEPKDDWCLLFSVVMVLSDEAEVVQQHGYLYQYFSMHCKTSKSSQKQQWHYQKQQQQDDEVEVAVLLLGFSSI